MVDPAQHTHCTYQSTLNTQDHVQKRPGNMQTHRQKQSFRPQRTRKRSMSTLCPYPCSSSSTSPPLLNVEESFTRHVQSSAVFAKTKTPGSRMENFQLNPCTTRRQPGHAGTQILTAGRALSQLKLDQSIVQHLTFYSMKRYVETVRTSRCGSRALRAQEGFGTETLSYHYLQMLQEGHSFPQQ